MEFEGTLQGSREIDRDSATAMKRWEKRGEIKARWYGLLWYNETDEDQAV